MNETKVNFRSYYFVFCQALHTLPPEHFGAWADEVYLHWNQADDVI